MAKHTITERENALRVFYRHAEPEWVPVAEDCFDWVIPSVMRERPVFGTDGKDWFGCEWIYDASCRGYAPNLKVPFVLEDITEWRDIVSFPDLDDIDWETAAKKDLANVDREQKLLRVMVESGVFERMHHLLGFEETLVSVLMEPEEFKALTDALCDYKIKLMDKIITYYQPDELFLMDDLGTANGLMISPESYRELIKPAHCRISEYVRSRGVIHTHHSCGKMQDLLQDLIETGAQMINPVQRLNDWKWLAETYSDKIVFNTTADESFNYPDYTEEELRQEVRKVIDIFGPYKRLILTCNITDSRFFDRMGIYLDEAREYGSSFYR